MSDRKLVVGLGNPGRKYAGTRHNIGFDVIERVATDWCADSAKSKFSGEIREVRIREQAVSLLCPQTFMNSSGKSIKAAADFYKLPLENLLVVCDDLALDLARLRFRPKGSSGGQNGLGDTIERLGSKEFSRLRVGIGKPPASWDVADFVLSKFKDDEEVEMQIAVRRASESVADWVEHGTMFCMNKYNGK